MARPWNDDIRLNKVSRRRVAMAKDAKKLSKIDPTSAFFQVNVNQSTEFDSISSTFGFQHHEGTNYQLELKIMKEILIRQGLLMTLQHICGYLNDKRKESLEQLEGEQIILTLKKIRDCTVNLLELIQLWRQSSEKFEAHVPRPFYWEGENYVLKLVIDLDFLAETPAIVHALHLPSEKYLSNPLMLPNTLHEGDVSTDPRERAQFDVGGEAEGVVFEERLRIRKAEQLLLREVEYYARETSPPPLNTPANYEEAYYSPVTKDFTDFGRPPTRGGDSRQGIGRGGHSNPVSSARRSEIPEIEMHESARGNITYSDIDRLCKMLIPSRAVQVSASIIIVLLSERYQVKFGNSRCI